MLAGAAFPFIIMCVFSTTIIMFANSDDLGIRIFATVFGDLLLLIAYVIFGRQNGKTAYANYQSNETKRSLGSTDKRCIYRTGEYALWKGLVIPAITALPFIVFQLVHIAFPNSFTEFMLLYVCGWAYYPLSLAGAHQAFNLLLILFPIGAHAVGYVIGKNQQEKLLRQTAEQNAKYKKHKK